MKEFILRHVFTRSFGEHLLSCIGIILIIFIGKDFLLLFLTTFLCAYIFHGGVTWCRAKILTLAKKSPKYISYILAGIAGEKTLLSIIYILFALACIFVIRDIGPALINDTLGLAQSLSQKFSLDLGISSLQETLGQWKNISTQIGNLVNVISPESDTSTLIAQILHIGSIFFQVIFGYILSFVWLMESHQVQAYFRKLQGSSFAFFYHDLRKIFEKIQKSFGLVFEAQGKIAIVNTILTVLGLFILGLFYGPVSTTGSYLFPYILALGCITLVTSFVPILGVFISGIPIIFAGAAAYPGWSIIVSIAIVLFIIHAVEGYFLNPRIVGQSLQIPAPVIFLILFVSEHFIGIAGFFLGVPLYLLMIELGESVGKIIKIDK